ncbi:MAG TPA: exodeoxyribonuclease VII large subunit [Vicinamibacterales bacterium]|nr:exodeoxyribonuclease VII large subunit [Vicinamibacterales bacterium]
MSNSLFDLPFEEPQESDPGRDPGSAIRDSVAAEPRRVYSVSQLTQRIREMLEERFFEIWVEGEISNCFVAKTGHVYFTLKDAGAQIKAVMFRSDVRYLRFKIKDGLSVVARGRLTVYDPKGEYQIICQHLEPEGLGARQLAFDQLKERLAKEGLFDARRKRPLPALPRKIGVVTSLDGAAVRDIVKVLRRRYANAHIVIRPARVQGEGAALDIARGMAAIGKVKGVDVVIVGRGGGSIEDLWAFNEEVVARAIAGCPVPTISAVGHETDVTIADFVADLRAPTPSAAAEMVVAHKDDFCARIDRLGQRLQATFQMRVAMRGRRADDLAHQLLRALRGRIARRERAYQALLLKLERFDVRRRFDVIRARLAAVDGRLRTGIDRRVHGADARFRATAARLDSLSPLAVLGRGYAVCWNADRTAIIRDASTVDSGDKVHVKLERGELDCIVTNHEGAEARGFDH